MPSTNKELAVDITIAYIHATGNLRVPEGVNPLIKPNDITAMIKAVYNTLEKLDDPNKQ